MPIAQFFSASHNASITLGCVLWGYLLAPNDKFNSTTMLATEMQQMTYCNQIQFKNINFTKPEAAAEQYIYDYKLIKMLY